MMKKHLNSWLGLGMAGMLCALLCRHGGDNEAMAACNAPPEYELVAWIDGSSLVCVNQDETFSVFANGPIDSYAWAAEGGSPASGEDYEFTTKWSSPGYNNVSVSIVGADRDENHDCKAEDEMEVTVVAVDSIDYFGKGVDTPHFVPVGTPVTFTAIPTPNGAWPSGKPAWGGVDNSAGATATKNFSTPGDYEITAECGNTVTEKVTAVKVDKLQYEQPSGTWNEISGTLYVVKDSTVNFKAVPAPRGSWPNGKPVWSGTSGASGVGETKTVTLNSLSATLTDYKTVAATCGNTLTANIVVYELTGKLVPDDNFTDRNQTKYGLDEIMHLSFITVPAEITSDQVGGLKWTKYNGIGAVHSYADDGNGTYFAGDIGENTPGNVTLRLTIQSGLCKDYFKSYDRQIVLPNGTRMTRTSPNVWHITNTASAGIELYYWLDPKDVSFNNLKFSEGRAPVVTTGVLVGLDDHQPSFFGRILGGNAVNGCRVEAVDHTSVKSIPWNAGDGTSSTAIPSEYIDYYGYTFPFGNQTAFHQVWANGNAASSKGGQSGSAAATDPTSSY